MKPATEKALEYSAKYYLGTAFLKLERKAPKNFYGEEWGTCDNQITHYYGNFAVKGAERRGFCDGLSCVQKAQKGSK